ncbi:hypothetical protein [Flagellimonas halotolerans]|uniref:Uncharacterized protein n=1 Tax=Flagellimonas halotolerans TaxID=3112164 RepID=A0ABU6IQD1_9FLAO|nr:MULTISPECIES: hypothetical protein [unclassified Allomuricauda]MEC3965279.1 hypothetical protein [Muricauda sp. SYSU M86414]MEC4265145.1 hypothetical protein [Muricauda sp. SYSU M84420]
MKHSFYTFALAICTLVACTPDNLNDDYPLGDSLSSPSKQQLPLQPMAHDTDSVIEDEDWDLSIPNAVGKPQDIIRHLANPDFDSIAPMPEAEPFSLEN